MQYERTFKNRISVSTYSNTFLRIWSITMDSLDDLLDRFHTAPNSVENVHLKN